MPCIFEREDGCVRLGTRGVFEDEVADGKRLTAVVVEEHILGAAADGAAEGDEHVRRQQRLEVELGAAISTQGA